jgi:hypothetical protein
MKKRDEESRANKSRSRTSTGDAIEQRVVEFAESMGRMVGTVQAKAEGWLDRDALSEQLTRIRDGASALLTHVGPDSSAPSTAGWEDRTKTAGSGRPKTAASDRKTATAVDRGKGRSGGVVDAPGKRHRKPAPRARGVKHSDDRIAKLKMNDTRRRGGR